MGGRGSGKGEGGVGVGVGEGGGWSESHGGSGARLPGQKVQVYFSTYSGNFWSSDVTVCYNIYIYILV